MEYVKEEKVHPHSIIGNVEEEADDSFQWEGAEVIGEVVSSPGSSSFHDHLDGHDQLHQTSATLDMDKSNWGPEEIAAYALLRSKRKKCIVSGCTSRSIPLARSYHQLPVRNLEVWQKWVEAIQWSKNDPDWLPSSTDQPLVCSRHFHPVTAFVSYEGSTRSRLNHNAVPSLYIDPPEGTVMDPKFSEERDPPQFVPFMRYSRSSKSNNKLLDDIVNGGSGSSGSQTNTTKHLVMPKMKQYPTTSGGLTINVQPKFKVERHESEHMEVTPEFNFEEPSEYDGEMAYEQDGDGEIDDYDEQISYINGFSKSRNSWAFHQETEIHEQNDEETEEDYPYHSTPQVQYQIPLNRRQPTLVPKPRVSISSILGKIKTEKQQRPQQPYTPNYMRRGVPNRAMQNNMKFRAGGSTGSSTSNLPSQFVKIERSEGNVSSTSNNFPRQILMKVPPPMSSGGVGGRESASGISGTTQKHKIGMSKCKLIISRIEQELEMQLQTIKVRVAQEMGVPTQVVSGVWQIKDKIKNGNNSTNS